MKIVMVGTGYVGLVTGTCFAESGNNVICVDIDQSKIDGLKNGILPIYEPGLKELVERNYKNGRLEFTTDLVSNSAEADIVYIGVGTPQGQDGSANLSALWAVVDSLVGNIRDDAIVVTKSTVPVGTNKGIYDRLFEKTGKRYHVASNPEFLKEGAAINDFMYPDRVVVGVRDESVAEILKELYAPFLRTDKPFLSMSPESAELTKYVANALLATKISFINEMANLCEVMSGDINDVRRGIGHDRRIGFQFLFPGVGYGGSCFPKDVRALASMSRTKELDPTILDAVDLVNDRQKTVLINKIESYFKGELSGKKFAVWGLAFKPKTDDIREAPALTLIDSLLDAGAEVVAFDPEAMPNVKEHYANHPTADKLTFVERAMDAIPGVDALAINTEWDAFRQPDFGELKSQMKSPIIFDGRNLYEPELMNEKGFDYSSIGRVNVNAASEKPA